MSTQAHHIHAAQQAAEDARLAASETRGFSAETATQIQEHRAKSNISWEALARAMGMSQATLHQCVHGTYKGQADSFEQKALSYFAMLQLREGAAHDIFETNICVQFLECVQCAKTSGEPVLVTHLPGVGASSAAIFFARSDSTAILITARRGIRAGRGSILHELRRALTRQKWRRKDERAGTLGEDVCRRLKGSGRVIIVDHADELSKDALSFLLSVREETGCAIVLVGAPRLHERIESIGDDGARPAAMGAWRELRWKTSQTLSATVSKLLTVLAPDQAEPLRRLAYQAAKDSHGNLRALTQRIRLAVTLAEGGKLTPDVAFDHARHQLVATTTAAERLTVMVQRRTADAKSLALAAA